MSEYPCRECPIRERCIDQSNLAARTKTMIRNAFAARTDTIATGWVLQRNCLVESIQEPKQGALLARLLQRRSATKEEPIPQAVQDPGPAAAVSPPNRSTPSAWPAAPNNGPDNSQPQFSPKPAQTPPEYCLIICASRRQIDLPVAGSLVLGRFDPRLTMPPDIDLTHEDRHIRTVSRRHARIAAIDTWHVIEDLGSANGVFVNGRRVAIGFHQRLKSGDHIMLGSLTLSYDRKRGNVPFAAAGPVSQVRHYLLNTQTGRKIELTPASVTTLGRLGSINNHELWADLDPDGNAATGVSRRHASIFWRDDIPVVQDLHSRNGTHLNGQRLAPRQAAALKPGDHLALGGCILTYDIENLQASI